MYIKTWLKCAVYILLYIMSHTCSVWSKCAIYNLLSLYRLFRCFDRFFRMVNINERRLVAWRRGFVTEKVDLVGLEYLWKAVLVAPDNIVYKPIELLRDVYTNLSPKLQQDQV